MTRWARAGSSQKHKKMPSDATKWGEFDHQKAPESFLKQQIKSESSVDHNKKKLCSNFSVKRTVDSNLKCKLPVKHVSSLSQPLHNIKSDAKIYNNETSNLLSHNELTQAQDVKSEEDTSLPQKMKVKKNRNKKKTLKQNIIHAKSSEVSGAKVFEKKKASYLEKLKKKRAENGILLLPSKIERKLYNIKRCLREKNLPPAVIKDIIRKERRKHELEFRKTFNPSKLCFNCRQPGHVLADCPEKLGSSNQETGICFKCGSAEHTSFKCSEKVQGFPFAKCFICKENGHISRDCSKNKHGVYPKGGRCNLCGNVNHLKKDCPSLSKKKENESTVTLETISEDTSIDAEVSEISHIKVKKEKKPKIVKF